MMPEAQSVEANLKQLFEEQLRIDQRMKPCFSCVVSLYRYKFECRLKTEIVKAKAVKIPDKIYLKTTF